MDFDFNLISFILHVDQHLAWLVEQTGWTVYLILFMIVFVETGLVVMPFLPGDSLLFIVGAFAGTGLLSLPIVLISLFAAAILGDMVNYHIGHYLGARAFQLPDGRFFKKKHLERTQQFYEKYGPKAIVIARFVPIVRTFAPFLAGVGLMSYPRFALYNVVGAFIWVFGIVTVGYLFGNLPWVKEYFSLVVLGIIALSVMPIIWEVAVGYYKSRRLSVAEPVVSTE